jgi:pimeloyl-ACP methyl ester carboxylesterase
MAIRKLAALLAREGFHVLRFDYYATGDSGGDTGHGSLSEWRQNIVSAASDIVECSGARTMSVIGLGLGAALAATAPLDVANLVLWDPVVSGTTYLEELRELHRRQYSPMLFPPPVPRTGAGGDLLGIPLPDGIEAELRAVDLLCQSSARAEHIALVVSEERPEYAALRARLDNDASRRSPLEYCHVPSDSQADQQEAILVSSHVLQAMASVLTRRAA